MTEVALTLGLEDTDRTARQRARWATVRRRRDLAASLIAKKAAAIHNGAPQDSRILCPVGGGGYYCQWVAGHYGGCVLGREGYQWTRRGL